MKKIIIAAGGKGTRVHELTGGVIPKSLCRISNKIPSPLIAYQLKQILDAGFTHVFLIFNDVWQIQLFKQMIKVQEVPNLTYSFACIEWGFPLRMFKDKNIIEFIGSDDFVLSYGDLFYSKDLLFNMEKLASKNNSSVASLMHSKSDRWKNGEKKITFLKDSEDMVSLTTPTEAGSFTLHAPFFFQKQALESINEEILCDQPHTISLLKRLIEKRQLSVFSPDFLLNMNTPEDIPIMEQGIMNYGA